MGKDSTVKESKSYREGFSKNGIGLAFSESKMQIPHFLWGQEGRNLLEDCLLVVIKLVRPGVLTGYLCLSVVVDKDIPRLHISHLLPTTVQCPSRLHQTQTQIPKLLVLEWLAWRGTTVTDLIPQQEGVVVELDLNGGGSTLQMPLVPQS